MNPTVFENKVNQNKKYIANHLQYHLQELSELFFLYFFLSMFSLHLELLWYVRREDSAMLTDDSTGLVGFLRLKRIKIMMGIYSCALT